MGGQRPSLLLLSAPGSPHGLALGRALSARWSVMSHLPCAMRRYNPAETATAILQRQAAAADLVVHLSADGAADLAEMELVEVYAPTSLALCHPSPAEAEDPKAWEALWRRERDLARRARLVVVPTAEAAEMMRLLYGVPASRLRQAPAGALPALLPLAFAPASPAPLPDTGFTLALNDYPIIGRPTGGAVRVRQGLAALGGDTVLLCLGGKASTAWIGPGMVQVAVPKTPEQRGMEADLRILTGAALEDLATAAHAPAHAALGAVAADLAGRARMAVFEHCYLAPLLDILRDAAPGLPVVYEAHNVEATLKRELLAGHPAEAALGRFVAEIETRLLAAANLVICCTEADAAFFRPQARQVVLMPHGVIPATATATSPLPPGEPPRIGFLGSAHGPNAMAARFVLEELAPLFPQAVFEIIGGVCAVLPSTPPNVVLRGILAEQEMSETLTRWTLALNPVETGGGASMKVADYLAHGLPSLNTPHAARGFPLLADGAGMVLPLAGFAPALARLLADPAALRRMGRAARDAAAAQSWPEVARPARAAIGALVAGGATGPQPLARGTCDDATVAPLRREGRPLPSPRASAPSAALSTLLREAGSMRRNAASRQALGLVRPYILLVGAAAPVPANAPPGVALVRYEDGIASQQDADGVGRRVAMPLAALVLASDPPCLRIIPGDMTDEAKKALRSLESWAAIPMIEKAEQINVF